MAFAAFLLTGGVVLRVFTPDEWWEAKDKPRPPRPKLLKRVPTVDPMEESPVLPRGEHPTSQEPDDDLGLLPSKGGRRGR